MAQGFEPSHSIALQYSSLDKQLIHVWGQDAAPASPMHAMSTDRMAFLSGPRAYSYDGTDNVSFDQDHILNQDLNEFKSPVAAPSFEGNEYSQPCDGPWSFDTPPYGEAESPTSPITSDLSQSSIWPSPTRQCFKQKQLAINMDITDPNLLPFGNDYPESDHILYIYPPDVEPLASCTINGSPPPPPVAPPAAEVRLINIEAAEDDVKTVGSPQIQLAAGKRRKKTASYVCPLRNNGCTATFTARHNLRYHIFAHKGEKPYRCRRCTYAASSPATLKRHQTTCKSTAQAIPVC